MRREPNGQRQGVFLVRSTPALAAVASNYKVHRAASYDTRWTDHSPVSVDYSL